MTPIKAPFKKLFASKFNSLLLLNSIEYVLHALYGVFS